MTPDSLRQADLSDFAFDQFSALDNKVQAFVNTAAYAVHLVDGLTEAANTVIEDLKIVLVGTNYTSGRNLGENFVDPTQAVLYGNTGYKAPFKQPDGLNQVSHAMAGIGLSYQADAETGEIVDEFFTEVVGDTAGERLGDLAERLREGVFGPLVGAAAEEVVERFLLLQEDEPWDDALYVAGFNVAEQLSNETVDTLPALIAQFIGNASVSTEAIPVFNMAPASELAGAADMDAFAFVSPEVTLGSRVDRLVDLARLEGAQAMDLYHLAGAPTPVFEADWWG